MRTKYANVPVTITSGERFDSKKEYDRWQELCLLSRAGVVRELRRQVPYELAVKGERIGRYVADFVYKRDGREVVEDVKSEPTRKLPAYRLKRRLMHACHGISITEV